MFRELFGRIAAPLIHAELTVTGRDYTHGPMNMALFILPNLQDHPQAAAASNSLLNMGVWTGDEQFFYTYVFVEPITTLLTRGPLVTPISSRRIFPATSAAA